jgi:hypothetical protein
LKHPEDAIQIAVADHLRARSHPDVLWWHTPNGGRRRMLEAVRFKKFGVLPGVSDIIAVHNGEIFGLELKAINGRPTESQLKFQSDLARAGGFGMVAHGLDQAIAGLEAWGLLKGRAA